MLRGRINDSVSSNLNDGIKFITNISNKFNKEAVVNSVTVIKPKSNEITETQDPLARFKKKSTIGPIIAIASVLGYLFKDKILNGLSLINEFIEPFSKFKDLKFIPERLEESITEKYETITNTVTKFIKSPIETVKAATEKIKSLNVTDIVSFIGAGLGISDQSLEKLTNLGSKIKSAVSGIFGRFVSNPFNIFSDIVTGKFAISVASWIFNKTKNIFSNIISFGNKSSTEIKYMNAQYSEEKYREEEKSKSLLKRFVSFLGSDSDTSPVTVAPVSQSAPGESQSSSNDYGNESIAADSGAHQSASGASGIALTPVTEDMIRNATIYESRGRWTSKEPWLRAFIAIESMGNPRADNGTFEGLFQLNRNYAMFNRGNRYNPQDNLRMAKAFWLSDCIPALKRAGIPITTLSLYMTHQQGPGNGPKILKNWLAGNDKRTGSIESRIKNAGKKSNGAAMNDKEFTEKWISEIGVRDSRLRNLTGGTGGITSVNYNANPVIKRNSDDIQTIVVDKIPSSISNKIEQPKKKNDLNFIIPPEFNHSFNQESTIEFSDTKDIIPVRLNCPNIIKMTLSTRML